MNAIDIIEKKKQNVKLSAEEIQFIINGYVSGDVPDYQMAAFLMAIRLTGLSNEELSCLTQTYIESGDVIDFGNEVFPTADKHSTGGVGDKVSLIIAPIVASCGVYMPKMSGKGLGHTGGTVDKLESIKGFNTSLSEKEFMDIVKNIHMAIIGQTKDIALADKKIYALRDVTGTVDSIPLIAASIMSKKLASGASNIVIDVKTGRGAIFEDYNTCLELAKTMVNIGKSHNRNVAAFLTDMNNPLGYTVGNKLEVIEARKFLNGEYADDLYEVCLNISAKILEMAFSISYEDATSKIENVIKSKTALKKFDDFIEAQGGDLADIPVEYDMLETNKVEILSTESGYVNSIDALGIAEVARHLGAGRFTKEDVLNYNVGVRIVAKPGTKIEKGEILAVIYFDDCNKVDLAEFSQLFTINNKLEFKKNMIYDTIV